QPSALTTLRNLVEGATGADVAALRETEYRANPTVPALLNLVRELEHTRDFTKLAAFAGILFEQIKDLPSAETYTFALYETNADDTIVAFADTYPEIVAASLKIGATVAWA
ncbi:MAG: hypothetical protein AAAB35_20080, partial [Phyllobacterium sp.]